MKVFVLLCLVACASASVLHHAPAVVAAPAIVSTGTSSSSRTQDAAGNYAFAYNEQHATGGSSRQEQGGHGVATGSYTLNVADGRQRVVNYVADGLGFRAAIATNEPGTAAQPAASTAISSPHLPPQQVAPVALAAPVAEVVAAPLAHAPIHHPVAVHAAPLLHAAPVAHHLAAPVAVAHVPAISSYHTAINHGHVVAAPLVAHHAPLAVAHHAPLAVAHHAPLLAHHAPLAHY